MLLTKIKVENFKCFDSREFLLHDQFNLIVGMNGTGKTSLLDACSVAIGSFLLGIDGTDSRHVRPHEVKYNRVALSDNNADSEDLKRYSWERQFPCSISAFGTLHGNQFSWRRALNIEGGRTTYGEAVAIKDAAKIIAKKAKDGEAVDLPVISYYGTGRLWDEPRENFRVKSPRSASGGRKKSRLDGYKTSVDPRLSVAQLTSWIANESWVAFQNGLKQTVELEVLFGAILGCIDGATDIYFDAAAEEVIVEIDGRAQPFSNISDGQRCMMALVGDIAKKAITLNPHLKKQALAQSKGVILIDELDLHLHPRWQRRLIENLRSVFPSIQFICTTHSPFLIQSLRDGEELLMLEGQPLEKTNNRSIEEISLSVQGVEELSTSVRYSQMLDDAKRVLVKLYDVESLSEPEKNNLGEEVDAIATKYADNPAYQAFLEMNKRAKLGTED